MGTFSLLSNKQVRHNRWNHWLRLSLVVSLVAFAAVLDWHTHAVFASWREGTWGCMANAASFCAATSGGVVIALIGFSAFLNLGILAGLVKLLSPVAYSSPNDKDGDEGGAGR